MVAQLKVLLPQRRVYSHTLRRSDSPGDSRDCIEDMVDLRLEHLRGQQGQVLREAPELLPRALRLEQAPQRERALQHEQAPPLRELRLAQEPQQEQVLGLSEPARLVVQRAQERALLRPGTVWEHLLEVQIHSPSKTCSGPDFLCCTLRT